MSEQQHTDVGPTHTQPPGATREAHGHRELLLMRAGRHAFALYADETDGVAHWLRPTPLPRAPRAVLGVVCVRGRMRTLLDPPALLDQTPPQEGANENGATPSLIVTLRGDEQLALAVEHAERVNAPEDALVPHDPPNGLARATIELEGTRVPLLDPAQLFETAMRGTERRRQRKKP